MKIMLEYIIMIMKIMHYQDIEYIISMKMIYFVAIGKYKINYTYLYIYVCRYKVKLLKRKVLKKIFLFTQ